MLPRIVCSIAVRSLAASGPGPRMRPTARSSCPPKSFGYQWPMFGVTTSSPSRFAAFQRAASVRCASRRRIEFGGQQGTAHPPFHGAVDIAVGDGRRHLGAKGDEAPHRERLVERSDERREPAGREAADDDAVPVHGVLGHDPSVGGLEIAPRPGLVLPVEAGHVRHLRRLHVGDDELGLQAGRRPAGLERGDGFATAVQCHEERVASGRVEAGWRHDLQHHLRLALGRVVALHVLLPEGGEPRVLPERRHRIGVEVPDAVEDAPAQAVFEGVHRPVGVAQLDARPRQVEGIRPHVVGEAVEHALEHRRRLGKLLLLDQFAEILPHFLVAALLALVLGGRGQRPRHHDENRQDDAGSLHG